MSDKSYHITVEALRSDSVKYLVIGICILLILYAAKTWFKDTPPPYDPLPKLSKKQERTTFSSGAFFVLLSFYYCFNSKKIDFQNRNFKK